MTPLSTMTIGAFEGRDDVAGVTELLDVPGIDVTVTDDIAQALWEKWAFIAAAGVATCLFRNAVGDIVAAGGEGYIHSAIGDLAARAKALSVPTPLLDLTLVQVRGAELARIRHSPSSA